MKLKFLKKLFCFKIASFVTHMNLTTNRPNNNNNTCAESTDTIIIPPINTHTQTHDPFKAVNTTHY